MFNTADGLAWWWLKQSFHEAALPGPFAMRPALSRLLSPTERMDSAPGLINKELALREMHELLLMYLSRAKAFDVENFKLESIEGVDAVISVHGIRLHLTIVPLQPHLINNVENDFKGKAFPVWFIKRAPSEALLTALQQLFQSPSVRSERFFGELADFLQSFSANWVKTLMSGVYLDGLPLTALSEGKKITFRVGSSFSTGIIAQFDQDEDQLSLQLLKRFRQCVCEWLRSFLPHCFAPDPTVSYMNVWFDKTSDITVFYSNGRIYARAGQSKDDFALSPDFLTADGPKIAQMLVSLKMQSLMNTLLLPSLLTADNEMIVCTLREVHPQGIAVDIAWATRHPQCFIGATLSSDAVNFTVQEDYHLLWVTTDNYGRRMLVWREPLSSNERSLVSQVCLFVAKCEVRRNLQCDFDIVLDGGYLVLYLPCLSWVKELKLAVQYAQSEFHFLATITASIDGKNEIDQRQFDSCELALNWFRESVAMCALKEQAFSAKDFASFDTFQDELLKKSLISSDVLPSIFHLYAA